MASSDFLKRQILEVSIGGAAVDAHAASFSLKTSAGTRHVLAGLFYPSDSETGNAGDDITVSVITDGKTDLYFTGVICKVCSGDSKRELILADSFKKLCETKYTCAYRKEKASVILEDILGAAGITMTSITCPDVELARFSTGTRPCRLIIDQLIDALVSHGFEWISYFFDAKDVFHFGTVDDTGVNEGEAYEFDTAKNILHTSGGWIETLPAPIRHTQKITVNGAEQWTIMTSLLISGRKSRLGMYIGEKYAER